MDNLEQAERLIKEINASNSINAKKAVLERYPELKELLKRVYDPFTKYGVSSANVKKQAKQVAAKRQKMELEPIGSLFELLDGLAAQRWTGHTAIAMVQQLIEQQPAHEALIYAVLDKDLKIGIKATLINAVWPDLIPQFRVVLANDYSDVVAKVDFSKAAWYASRKLDGCRCIVMFDAQGECKFYSRAGNEFTALDNAKPDLATLGLTNAVLDCEACVLNADGSENFAQCVSQIKKKNFTIAEPKLYLFDLVPLDAFLQGYCEQTYSYRQERLQALMSNRVCKRLCLLEQTRITDPDQLANESDKAQANGWEGLILRKDLPYEAKRSNDTLKVKRFLEAEFEVKRCEFGTKQMLRDGVKQTIDTLASVVVEFQGCEVHVGSGFTDEERERLFANPDSIIGKQITVQYFEATENSRGGKSMRFPTKKAIWWQPRDV